MANTRGQFQVDFLRSVVANGGKIAGARFSLQQGGLKAIEPMYSITLDQHGVRSLQELAWTPELEKLLLFDLRCKMDTREDEAERFAAILLNNIGTAETHHGGKDFAHAVLVAELRDRREYNLEALLDRAGTAARADRAGTTPTAPRSSCIRSTGYRTRRSSASATSRSTR